MATLKNIAVHHAGGLGNDVYASTRSLTVESINAAHKTRWNFPSSLKDKNGKPWYFGYNVIYDPKDRSFTQGRALGEETAAQYGYNFDTFSICIIGNYMKKPLGSPAGAVDPFDKQIQEDITLFLFDLINGNKRALKVEPGTTLNFAISRVQPHRFFGQTDCYGSYIADSFFRDQLVAYKPVPLPVPTPPPAPSTELEKRNALSTLILQVVMALADFLQYLREVPPLGTRRDVAGWKSGDYACDGTV